MTRGEVFCLLGGFAASIVVGLALKESLGQSEKHPAPKARMPSRNADMELFAAGNPKPGRLDQHLTQPPLPTMDLTDIEIEELVLMMNSIIEEIKGWESDHVERVDEFSSGDEVVWLCIPPLRAEILNRARDAIDRYCSEHDVDASSSKAARRLERIMGLNGGRNYIEIHARDRLGIATVSVYTMPGDEELKLNGGILQLRNIPMLMFSKGDPFVTARFDHLFQILDE